MKPIEHYLKKTQQQGDCLVWLGARTTDGYPRALINGNSNVRLHRRIAEVIHGTKLTPELVVMHSCDNPLCLNPDHLVIGTHKTNVYDQCLKGRQAPAKLTPTQVRMILASSSAGISNVALAQQFNVDPRTISSIKCGRSWKSIPRTER